MNFPPLSYNLRSLWNRRSATLLTVIGIGATVAVLAGVLALQQGFYTLFADNGRDDVAVFIRPGSTNEGDSVFPRSRTDVLIKTVPEIAVDERQQLIASREMYLAVRMQKATGGETNVPIRGVEPMSFTIAGDQFRMVEGRRFERGTDEIIVGQSLVERIQNCRLDDVIVLNTAPFRVVGVFQHDGPYSSEIWGDSDRLIDALERPAYSRILAQLRDDADVPSLAARMEEHKEVPAQVLTEREYLKKQTGILSAILIGLGAFLAIIMGTAAIFTGTNTMLSAIAARTHEIGILLSLGFRPVSIFLSFLFESLTLGLIGGVLGCLLVIPLNGVRTGTTNFATFTEVAFAFRITPSLLTIAVVFSLGLGLVAGAWPAWRAARLAPTEALRRT